MNLWSGCAYFDSGIFDIFKKHLENGSVTEALERAPNVHSASDFRKNAYRPFVRLWMEIIGIVEKL
jgi:hypothetical protein